MTIEETEIPRATGYSILHDPESGADPILVLTTELGDHHFVLSRDLFRQLAKSCERAGKENE